MKREKTGFFYGKFQLISPGSYILFCNNMKYNIRITESSFRLHNTGYFMKILSYINLKVIQEQWTETPVLLFNNNIVPITISCIDI